MVFENRDRVAAGRWRGVGGGLRAGPRRPAEWNRRSLQTGGSTARRGRARSRRVLARRRTGGPYAAGEACGLLVPVACDKGGDQLVAAGRIRPARHRAVAPIPAERGGVRGGCC